MDDLTLFDGFEAGTLSADDFGHREHVRTAFLYLRRFGNFGFAGARFTEALHRFVERNGAAHKFHETLTWAYLALIAEAIDDAADVTSEDLFRRHPELATHRDGPLARLYALDVLEKDARARRVFLLPGRS